MKQSWNCFPKWLYHIACAPTNDNSCFCMSLPVLDTVSALGLAMLIDVYWAILFEEIRILLSWCAMLLYLQEVELHCQNQNTEQEWMFYSFIHLLFNNIDNSVVPVKNLHMGYFHNTIEKSKAGKWQSTIIKTLYQVGSSWRDHHYCLKIQEHRFPLSIALLSILENSWNDLVD